MPATVLLVEDERRLRELVRSYLERAGFTVLSTGSGAEALTLAASGSPDLVVLDLGLPDIPGETVARELRSAGSGIPVLMLTAKSGEEDRIRGLELGADDYVTKPFSIRELLARVKAVLRRAKTSPKEKESYSFGEVEVNLKSCQVSRAGKELDFSSKEFELLKYFLCHPGEALTRDRLLEDVWGYDRFPTTRTVDAHIVRLRQKVEPKPEEPRFILTVHGTGYKFVG